VEFHQRNGNQRRHYYSKLQRGGSLDSHAQSDAVTKSNGNGYTERDIYSDSHIDLNANGYGNSNGYSYGNGYLYAYTYT